MSRPLVFEAGALSHKIDVTIRTASTDVWGNYYFRGRLHFFSPWRDHVLSPDGPRHKSTVTVSVKTMQRGTLELNRVRPWDTIGVLKRRLRDLTDIPIAHQRLIYVGKQLEDGTTVAGHGIIEGLPLHLVLRLPPGDPGRGASPTPAAAVDVAPLLRALGAAPPPHFAPDFAPLPPLAPMGAAPPQTPPALAPRPPAFDNPYDRYNFGAPP